MKKFLTLFAFFCAFNGLNGVANADFQLPMKSLVSGDRYSVAVDDNTSYDKLVQFAVDKFGKFGVQKESVEYFVLSGSKISKTPLEVNQDNWGDIREKLLKEKSHSEDQLTIVLKQESATRQE